jgi:tRNA(adenine34) deaminase
MPSIMERCIALAIRAMDHGEYPYAAVVCRNGEIVCESINSVRNDRDVSHHAEMIAISEALRRLNRVSLEDCTIYATADRYPADYPVSLREPPAGQLFSATT